MKRTPIYGLEFLRGLCAVAVAVYHCLGWAGFEHPYNWGLYGVYIFFAISGAVLYYNYRDLQDVSGFLRKRFARLAPLYILCLGLTMLGKGAMPGWTHALNASLLFGFTNPGWTPEVGGGWSIGIEVAFYALFPVLLVFTRDLRTLLTAVAVTFFLRIASVESTVHGTLDESWGGYTQIGSFLFFFFAGMAVAQLMERTRPGPVLYTIGAVATFIMFAVPLHEPVLTGFIGAGYAVLCIVVLMFFYPLNLPGSRFLGEISYGLYLLHPIVWVAFKRLGVPAHYALVLTVPCASIAAWVILRFYEIPAKRWLLSLRLPAKSRLVGDARD